MDLVLLVFPPLIVGVAWLSIQTKVLRRATRRGVWMVWGTLIIALLLALALVVLRPGRYATLSLGGIATLTVMFALAERIFLRLPKEELRVRVGDPFPPFAIRKMDGTPYTQDDLFAAAPAYIIFYRGYW